MFDTIFLLAGFARRFWPERPQWVKGMIRSDPTINSTSSSASVTDGHVCVVKLNCLCHQGVTGDPGVVGLMGSPGKQVSSKQFTIFFNS